MQSNLMTHVRRKKNELPSRSLTSWFDSASEERSVSEWAWMLTYHDTSRAQESSTPGLSTSLCDGNDLYCVPNYVQIKCSPHQLLAGNQR